MIPFVAFIALGMPDGLLGIAWPGIRFKFNLPIESLGFILMIATAGYMFSSFLSGFLIRYLGFGMLLSLSCLLSACSLYIFSQTKIWLIFIIFAGINGIGAGAIDASINTYVAKYYNKSIMQWLHACFGIGITLGPIIMTMAISINSRWEIGYHIVSILLGTLCIVFFVTKKIWNEKKNHVIEDHFKNKETSIIETVKNQNVLLSMLMFFLYNGVELGLGYWTYSLLTESRQLSQEISGFIASSYWASFTIGRILAGFCARLINSRKLICICVSLAFLGIILLMSDLGEIVTTFGISLAGLAVAPIFPSMVSNTASRVDSIYHTNTIGLQMTASAFGMAVIPSIAGIIAKFYGLEIIPLFLIIVLFLMLLIFLYLNPKFKK